MLWKTLIAAAIAAMLSACAVAPQNPIPASTFRATPGKELIGKSKEEIVACAGKPYSTMSRGSREHLVYRYSGSGPRPGGSDKNWTCTANLTFEGGRLADVAVANKSIPSPEKSQTVTETWNKPPQKRPEPCSFVLACGR